MVEFSNFFFTYKLENNITYYILQFGKNRFCSIKKKKKNLVQSAEIDKFHIYIYSCSSCTCIWRWSLKETDGRFSGKFANLIELVLK